MTAGFGPIPGDLGPFFDPDARLDFRDAPAPLHSTPPTPAELERWAAVPDPEPEWRPGDLARSVWDRGAGGWRLEPVDPDTGEPIAEGARYSDELGAWIAPGELELERWAELVDAPAGARATSLDTGATTRQRTRDERDLERLHKADRLKRELGPLIRRAAGLEASIGDAPALERAAWLDARAVALAGCREVRAYREATCGAYIARPSSCRVRVCPDCERARSTRLVTRLDSLALDMVRPVFWTFTVPNVPRGELDRGIDWLLESFRALRRRAVIRGGPCRGCGGAHAPVAGGVYSIEVTPGRDRRSWHPHAHVLMDAPFIRWAELRDSWRAVTCDAIRKLEARAGARGGRVKVPRCSHPADERGIATGSCRGASIVWVEAVRGEPGSPERRAAIRETLKYATGGLVKDGKLAAGVDADAIGELLLALRNRRLVAGWAAWRHVHDADEEDAPPDELSILVDTGAENRLGQPVYERMPAVCPCCRAPALYELPITVPRAACRPRDGTLTWRAPPPGRA